MYINISANAMVKAIHHPVNYHAEHANYSCICWLQKKTCQIKKIIVVLYQIVIYKHEFSLIIKF
jgi:hypothetical protein